MPSATSLAGITYDNDDLLVVVRERVGFRPVVLIPWIADEAAMRWSFIDKLEICITIVETPISPALSDPDMNKAMTSDRPSFAMVKNPNSWVLTRIGIRIILEEDRAAGILFKKSSQSEQ